MVFCAHGQLVLPTGLEGYLRFTQQQTEELRKLREPVNQTSTSRRFRVMELSAKLSEALGEDPLDAFKLGSYYSESLKLHSDEVTDRKALAVQIRKLLTPEQEALMNALVTAQTMTWPAHTAVCDGLIPPPPPDPLTRLTNALNPLPCAIDGFEYYYHGLFNSATIRPPNLPRFLELTDE